jgi:hypothetical protein
MSTDIKLSVSKPLSFYCQKKQNNNLQINIMYLWFWYSQKNRNILYLFKQEPCLVRTTIVELQCLYNLSMEMLFCI